MAKANKFVHFNTRAAFEAHLTERGANPSAAEGNDLYYYTVYIKDTEEIYTHGKFYGDKGVEIDILALQNGDIEVGKALYQKLAERYETVPGRIIGHYVYKDPSAPNFAIHAPSMLIIFDYNDVINAFSGHHISVLNSDIKFNFMTLASTGECVFGDRTIVTEDMFHTGNKEGTIGLGATDIPVRGLKSAAYVDVEELVQPMINITYAELYNLVILGKLVPGQKYRIIDYETTTSDENTKSAGHVFDLVVTALSKNELSHDANALRSDRDTDNYFGRCNLSAWKIRYDIYNDTSKYAWAVPNQFGYDSSNCTIKSGLTNGNTFINPIPVIYSEYYDSYNKQDYTNELAGILLYEYAYDNETNELCIYPDNGDHDNIDKYMYRGIKTVNGIEYDYWQKKEGESLVINTEGRIYIYTQRIVDGDIVLLSGSNGGKGVIYHMIDEWNNECPYDFKNIMFERWQTNNNYGVSWYIGSEGFGVWMYTFAKYNLDTHVVEDGSHCIELNGYIMGCYNNKISHIFSDVAPILLIPNNVLILHQGAQYCSSSYNVYLETASHNTIIECHDISINTSSSNALGLSQYIFMTDSSGNEMWRCYHVDMTYTTYVKMLLGNYMIFERTGSIHFNNEEDIVNGYKTEMYNYLIRGIYNRTIDCDDGDYLKTVALNSNGEVKMYCEADLIA